MRAAPRLVSVSVARRCARGAGLTLALGLLAAGVARSAPPAGPASGGAPAPAVPAPASPATAAARTLLVPASAEQRALALELAADGLWLRVCEQARCDARSGRARGLPEEAQVALAGAALQVLELETGRRVAHVRVPTGADSAWEALAAAPLAGAEPLLLFVGTTGAVRGEDGAREGEQVWIREGDSKGRRVLVGKLREDVQLCGRPTILEAHLLDRELALRPAKVQQLGLDERRSARVIDARRLPAPTGTGNVLRALAASSAIGNPAALTDGRNDTSWAEGRGGDGRGEFVTFRPLSGAALVALEFLVRPDGAPPAGGAAPRSLWLATRSALFRVDLAEDAWQTPGVWYRVELPEPVTEDCVAIVLESSYASGPDSQVTLSEVRGVGELSGLDPVQLVARLSTPGDAGAEVVPALLQAGPAGVAAVVGAFGALDAVGRQRALDVLETGACDVVGGVYVTLLTDGDARTRRRAEQRLRGCGEGVWGELREAFESSSDETGVLLAQALSELAPALAVELVTPRLGTAGRAHRGSYRAALARASRQAEAEPGLRRLLASGATGDRGDLELLRATAELLPQLAPESGQAFARAAAAATTFEQRYLLLSPAAALAARDPGARAFLQRALRDPDAYLRRAAARLLPPLGELQGALLAATRDPEVRVREASVARLGEWRSLAAAGVLAERLRDDAWPLVRAAAAHALAGMGPAAELDAALVEGLEDTSELVRAATLRALGQRGARRYLPELRERFSDDEEQAAVRAAAAQALAQLCDAASLPALTEAAQALLAERSDADDMLIGSAAVAALGRLHPPDLSQRLAGLVAARQRPALGQLAVAALQTTERCRAAASNARQR